MKKNSIFALALVCSLLMMSCGRKKSQVKEIINPLKPSFKLGADMNCKVIENRENVDADKYSSALFVDKLFAAEENKEMVDLVLNAYQATVEGVDEQDKKDAKTLIRGAYLKNYPKDSKALFYLVTINETAEEKYEFFVHSDKDNKTVKVFKVAFNGDKCIDVKEPAKK